MLLRAGGVVFVVMLAFWLYCLLDAITSDRERVRVLPKGAWVAIVLLLFEIGALLWFLFGRPRSGSTPTRAGGAGGPDRPTGAWPGWGATTRPSRPAPDDDPEFLARLDRQVDSEHEDLLGLWEEDLRRREEELRREREDPPE